MQIVIIAVMAVVFTVVIAVGQSVYWAYAARQERDTMERLRRLNVLGDQDGGDGLLRERARDAAAMALGSLGAHFQETIEAADRQLTVGALIGQMFVAALGTLVVSYYFAGIFAIIIAVIGAFGPYFYLRYLASARATKLVEQLPEALDLMARSLQAGLGLNEAFRTCAEEMQMPVAGEFGRVFEEVRLGREYRDALTNMVRRNPTLFDLRLFVSSVLLQRETGGNLIEILESISGTIRGRFIFQAKVKAMTSEARFSAIILGGLPIAVAGMVAVMSPSYLAPMFTEPLGQIELGIFFFLYAVGGFLMYTVSQVEV
jgi:tight adherence protein B